MGLRPSIRLGHSTDPDAVAAVRELHAALAQDDPALVLFFCSGEYDLDVLAAEMRSRFAGVPVVGCTTAGEIGPAGYRSRSLSGLSLGSASFATATGLLNSLHDFTLGQGQSLVGRVRCELDASAPRSIGANTFGLLLIDGLSIREEPVAQALHYALEGIPLFGGSAGDGVRFGTTLVYHGGRFHPNSAVLTLVSTDLPFRVFKTQHFRADTERLVVTEADPAHRVVSEINGLPAAEEYARLNGVTVADLGPMQFAASPVVVVIDGTDYVRSIQQVNPDGSLVFYSAIDVGLVLRVARRMDLVDNLRSNFDRLRAEIGPPELVIGCDCILRNLEIAERGQTAEVGHLFRANNTVGFSTYGEQFGSVHVNQTFTGVAIGAGTADAGGRGG